MNESVCLSETRYRLQRALRIRGYSDATSDGRDFMATGPDYSYRLTIMPGNRRVLISSNVWVTPEKRGHGLGRKLLAQREEVAKEAGCNLILATVRNDNAVEVHLLESAGWKRFTNRTTGVSLWGKEL